MIPRKLHWSAMNLQCTCQIKVGLGKVWLAEGFCLFSCNATRWSIAFPVRLFHHICRLKNSKILWTCIWWEEVSGKCSSFRALLSITAALLEQLQSPLSKPQTVLNDKRHFCTLLYYLIAGVSALDYIRDVSFKLIKSVRSCWLISFPPLRHSGVLLLTVKKTSVRWKMN